jgi:hypothetical protein
MCNALEHSRYSLESLDHQWSEDLPESHDAIFQNTFASAQVPIISHHQFPAELATIPSNSESLTEKPSTQFEVGRSLYDLHCWDSAGLKNNQDVLHRSIGLTEHDHPQDREGFIFDENLEAPPLRFSETSRPESRPRSSQDTSSPLHVSQADWENYVFHILHEQEESVTPNSHGSQFTAGYSRTQQCREGVHDQSSRRTQPSVTIPDGSKQPPAIKNPRIHQDFSTSHLPPNYRGIMAEENELGHESLYIPGSNGLSNPNGACDHGVQNRIKQRRIPNMNGHSAAGPEPTPQNWLLEPSDLGSLLRGLESGVIEALDQKRRNLNKSHSKAPHPSTPHQSLPGESSQTPTTSKSSPTSAPNYYNPPSDTSNSEIPLNFSYQALLHSKLTPIQLSPTVPFHPEYPDSGRFDNDHSFLKDNEAFNTRVGYSWPHHGPDLWGTNLNSVGPWNQQSSEILSEATWADLNRLSTIPTNRNNNRLKAPGFNRPTEDDKHSTTEPPRFLGRDSRPTDRNHQRSKIFRFDAQVFRFGYAETDHQGEFYQEFIDEIQSTPSKELVILDCPSIKRYRNLIKQIVHAQALLERHSPDNHQQPPTKETKKLRLAERRSMLTEATNLVFKNRRLWYKFWAERTGINFETVEVLHKAGYSQKLLENEFVLFIFYVDMIATIIPVYDSDQRIIDPAELALLRDHYSARLVENALHRYRLLGIVQIHQGELHTYVRPQSQKTRKRSRSSTRHHHPSKPKPKTKTSTSSALNKDHDDDDEDDPDYKKFCGRDLLAKVWLSLASFIKSLPPEYQVLRDILFEERHPHYVSHYPKMFFNDLFSYSILILNQRLKSYYPPSNLHIL